jgi:hypothetical protein
MKDREFAQVNGPIKVLGINDKSLYEALAGQLDKGPGKEFVAFVLPKFNKSINKIRPVGGTRTLNAVDPAKLSGTSPYELKARSATVREKLADEYAEMIRQAVVTTPIIEQIQVSDEVKIAVGEDLDGSP